MKINDNDIEDLEEEYFKQLNKKGIIFDVSIKPNLSFDGFGSSFELKEETPEKIDVVDKVKNTVIKIGSLSDTNKKSLL